MNDEDLDHDLEEGQEKCPFCGEVNWPGAMEYCDHYLWTRWDGQLIWEIPAAATLRDTAGELCELIQQADENGMLAETTNTVREIGHDDLARLFQDPWDLCAEDLMSPSYLLLGELRETGGMLSGGGSAEFLAGNASRWADQRTRKLDDLTAAVRCLLDSGRPKCS